MSDEDTQTNDANPNADPAMPDELTMLKQRAAMMGITHSNNISIATLKAKIDAKMAGEEEKSEDTPAAQVAARAEANPLAGENTVPTKKLSLRDYLIREEMKLIRIRVTNMDPKKKDLPGEILTVANEFLGTVSKFVPFGEQTDDGWHVPKCIYNMMVDRKFLNITTTSRNGRDEVNQRWAKEFAIEVLEPLTPVEMHRLAAAQASAGLFSNSDNP